MLKITAKLRKHLQKEFSLATDATEADARELAMEKVASGELTTKQLDDLATEEASEAENRLQAIIDKSIAAALAKATPQTGTATATEDDAAKQAAIDAKKAADRKELVTKMASVMGISEEEAESKLTGESTAAKGYGLAGSTGVGSDETFVRVKSVAERFAHNPTAATWDHRSPDMRQKHLGGNVPAQLNSGMGEASRDLNMPTERSKAIAGAWFKHLAVKAYKQAGVSLPADRHLTQMDRDLITYAAHECKFVGPIGFRGDAGVLDDGNSLAWGDGNRLKDINGFGRTTPEMLIKAILDDSTSGGLEAVPIEYDDNFILTPLLEGELFPLVSLQTVSRRRIEATKFGNFTMSWGTAEGTAISLFNTDAFISAFDTTIYPVTGAVLTGLDFLADSPLNVGNIMVNRWGSAFRKEMDDVIADGNGTNRPTGIFQTSGFNSVSAASAGNDPQVGDYESLYFDIPKEYRNAPGARFIYVSTDTSYKRARGIPVDSSSDARRIFGMDQKSYTIFDNPYRITSASGVTNAEIAGVMINFYRMYRRQGLEVRVETGGESLARSNQQLIVVRARFGGQMEFGAAMSKITDSQA